MHIQLYELIVYIIYCKFKIYTLLLYNLYKLNLIYNSNSTLYFWNIKYRQTVYIMILSNIHCSIKLNVLMSNIICNSNNLKTLKENLWIYFVNSIFQRK